MAEPGRRGPAQARSSALVAPAEAIFLDVKTEAELAELPEDEAAEMRAEARAGRARAGPAGPGRVPRARPDDLPDRGPEGDAGLGDPVGATAPEAAGVIHTDFQRGFIKAEVVSYDDLVAAGSLPAARAAGKARIEGKDYVMRDGDVVEFRFNV